MGSDRVMSRGNYVTIAKIVHLGFRICLKTSENDEN